MGNNALGVEVGIHFLQNIVWCSEVVQMEWRGQKRK